MRHPGQQALASCSSVPIMPPSSVTQETARLIVETIPFNLEYGGRTIEITYSIRNGIVAVRYWGRALSVYSPQGDEAGYKAVARRPFSVMLGI